MKDTLIKKMRYPALTKSSYRLRSSKYVVYAMADVDLPSIKRIGLPFLFSILLFSIICLPFAPPRQPISIPKNVLQAVFHIRRKEAQLSRARYVSFCRGA